MCFLLLLLSRTFTKAGGSEEITRSQSLSCGKSKREADHKKDESTWGKDDSFLSVSFKSYLTEQKLTRCNIINYF